MSARLYSDHLLRQSLRANAGFSGICGVAFLLAHAMIGSLIGLTVTVVLLVLGIGLMAFAAGLIYLASRPEIGKWWVLIVVASDVVWVAGSAVLVMAFPAVLNGAGRIAVIIIAMIVLMFAYLQAYGLWKIRQSATPQA